MQSKPNRESYTKLNMQGKDGKQGIQVTDICKLCMYVHVGKSGLGLGRLACIREDSPLTWQSLDHWPWPSSKADEQRLSTRKARALVGR